MDHLWQLLCSGFQRPVRDWSDQWDWSRSFSSQIKVRRLPRERERGRERLFMCCLSNLDIDTPPLRPTRSTLRSTPTPLPISLQPVHPVLDPWATEIIPWSSWSSSHGERQSASLFNHTEKPYQRPHVQTATKEQPFTHGVLLLGIQVLKSSFLLIADEAWFSRLHNDKAILMLTYVFACTYGQTTPCQGQFGSDHFS